MDQYLTEERLKELKEKLKILKTEKRQEIARRLRRAKELGDLSENSEYQEARDEQQRVERKIVEIELVIKNAKIITKTTGDTVMVGSKVEVEKNGQKLAFFIVGPSEANPTEGKISDVSPIGQALLGKKAGDKAIVKTPSGETTYTIVSIK